MKKIEFEDYSVVLSRKNRFIKSRSNDYHFLFNSDNGLTCKFGKSVNDDPDFSPFGNEIADIEITTSCRGIRDKEGNRSPCPFCYKGNSESGEHMSFERFKRVFDLLNQSRTMTQIAFGVDAECKSNPDVWKIMDYCIQNDVVPNVTVADIDEETALNIAKRCGACSVSAYERDKGRCYDSIKLLTDASKEFSKKFFQVNIHLLLSEETKDFCKEVIKDYENDLRLKDVNAIVFLSLKQKGRGSSFHRMNESSRKEILSYCLDNDVKFGMDSCGANFFLDLLKERKEEKRYLKFIEPCESLLYSIYVNVEGKVFPCSFMEGEGEWSEGIDLLDSSIECFRKEVWENEKVISWRRNAIKKMKEIGCNSCPYFTI